jgi:glycosyltransferase AglD
MKPGGRKRLFHGLSLVLGVGLVVAIGWHAGLQRVLGDLGRLSPWILVPLSVVYAVSWAFRGLRMKKIIHILGGRMGFLESTGVELLGDLANQVIPAKLGDVTKVVYLRRKRCLDTGAGVMASLLVRLSDLLAVSLMTMASLVLVTGEALSGLSAVVLAVAGVIAVATGGTVLFMRRPSVFTVLLAGPLRKHRPSVEVLAGRLRGDPGGLLTVLLQSCLVWVFDILTLYIFLDAFDVNLGFARTAFVLLLSNLMKIIPLTPNGIGVYEGAMVVLLGRFAIPQSTAFTIGVLDHAFMNVFSLLLSVIALYGLGIRLSGLKSLTGDEELQAGER